MILNKWGSQFKFALRKRNLLPADDDGVVVEIEVVPAPPANEW